MAIYNSSNTTDHPEQKLALQASYFSRDYRDEVARRILAGYSWQQIAQDTELEKVFRRSGDRANLVLERCFQLSVAVVPLGTPLYPRMLAASASPPLVIFARSGAPAEQFPDLSVAIVGARAASLCACQRASQLAFDLAQAGVTIVSGLALGIDGAAHRGALNVSRERTTVAVLAHGLDLIYPRSHEYLARSIIDRGGMLISEYPPGTEPLKHHFLERNRIIAGLVRGVVVYQAGERSGSLVTATYAADYGRDVFVPHECDQDEQNRGANRLLQDGAIPITGASEILTEYGFVSDGLSRAIRTVSRSELLELAGGSIERVLNWELEGRVAPTAGGGFVVRDLGQDRPNCQTSSKE